MQPRLYCSLCGVSRFPSQVGCLRLGHTLPWCAQAARCPGLELSPATEKIIKNRALQTAQLLAAQVRLTPQRRPARRPGDPGWWHNGWRRMLLEVYEGGRRPGKADVSGGTRQGDSRLRGRGAFWGEEEGQSGVP